MDYSYILGAQSQPLSLHGLHGLPTPDPNPAPRPDNLEDAFSAAALNYHNSTDHGNNNDSGQNYPPFDPSFGLDSGAAASFVRQQPPPHSPPDSLTQPSTSDNTNALNESNLGRSSSEEKDGLSQDPNKRKAQNRAAQRAFRERKERHVHDLEGKVKHLEEKYTAVHADNERLRQELARFATENEILRATSQSFANSNNNNNFHNHGHRPELEPTTIGPMKYTPMDFSSSNLVANGQQQPSNSLHRVTFCPVTGDKLLSTGATWDLIQGHELFTRGLVDIEHISERLKSMVQCNGQGPSFGEGAVRKVIEECAAASGGDQLK